MIRPHCILVLFGALALGCESTNKQEKEPFTQNLWKDMLREDAQRLKSENEIARENKALGKLGETGDALWNTIINIYNYLTGNTPFNAAKNMIDPAFPDRRRLAVMYLSKRDYGREDPYLKYYAEMARTDDDHLVRAIALRALNRSRDKRVIDIYIEALGDKHELVRLEAAKSLANMPDPKAIQALIKHLADTEENVDVRVACADALRSFKNSDAALALVDVLLDRNFGVAWQARKSLNFMTGKDYRFDRAEWLSYFSGASKPFG